MKQKQYLYTTIAAALVALAAVGSIAFATLADETGNTNPGDAETGLTKPFHFGRRGMMNLSDEQKAELQAQWEAKQAEFQARHDAVEAALEANDYNAWVEAIGQDSPILDKINQDNFSRFVEAHNLMEQSRAIMDELGVGGRGIMGYKDGMGRGMGLHKFSNPSDNTDSSTVQ